MREIKNRNKQKRKKKKYRSREREREEAARKQVLAQKLDNGQMLYLKMSKRERESAGIC